MCMFFIWTLKMVSYIGATHHLTHIQIVVHHFLSIWGTVVHSLLHQAKLLGSANGKKIHPIAKEERSSRPPSGFARSSQLGIPSST